LLIVFETPPSAGQSPSLPTLAVSRRETREDQVGSGARTKKTAMTIASPHEGAAQITLL
jgi:hypothetical protein